MAGLRDTTHIKDNTRRSRSRRNDRPFRKVVPSRLESVSQTNVRYDLAIDSKLRACDLIRLRVSDISQAGRVGSRAMVLQQKTRRPVQFEITEQTRETLTNWIRVAGLRTTDYLFPSRMKGAGHLSTRQYARVLKTWIVQTGLDPSAYATHSMRRTKVTLIYRRTKNLRAVQLLLGHNKLESTVRYLGIEVEDALEIAEQTEA